ncbi:hypothetical protein V7193_18215 [Bacillus velezensis]
MGKKQRNRVTGQKQKIHVPFYDGIAADEAHGKEHSAAKRKP